MIVFRLSQYDTPFPPSPSRRSGRFSAEGDPVANYWSLHPHGPWAERMRWEAIHDPHAAGLRGRVWAAHLEVPQDIDGTLVTVGFADAERLGLTAAQLVADDHGPCQAAAAGWRSSGTGAVVVPSAALPGTDNLVLFGQRLPVRWLGPVTDPGLDVRTALVGDHAVAPSGIAASVCHFGQPHDALTAHLDGRPFHYAQHVEAV